MTASLKQIVMAGIIFIVTVLMAILPFIFIFRSAGSSWQGIIPAGYVADSEFYIVQMMKGTNLFPFGNNPYFIERADEFNPALIGADYIAAIPLKLGFSLMGTLIFNSIFWNIVFVFFLGLFLKRLGITINWMIFLIPFVYMSVYGAMIRPVVWQTVLPFFMFFIYTLSVWLEEQSLVNKILLAISVAGTLYVYPYTWQISFLILGMYFIWFLINRRWQIMWSELEVLILALAIAFPVILYVYKITSDPLFPEFLKNIGSINTHLPSKVSLELVRWVFISLFLWHIIVRFNSKLKANRNFNLARGLLSTHGLAIMILALSPIVTGRDGAIGDHLGRELFFWLPLSTAVILYFIFSGRYFKNLNWLKRVIIFLLLVINIFPVVKHYKRSFLQPFKRSTNEIVAAQDYAKPILWLENYDKGPAVVWSSSNMSNLIPIFSKNYSLEPPDLAYQYGNDQKEIQERYLISQYFKSSNPEIFSTSTALGLSYFRRFDDLKWKAELCHKLKFLLPEKCVPKNSGLTFSETAYQKDEEILRLMEQNKKEIKPQVIGLLKKYNVKYAIKDIKNDPSFKIEGFKNVEEIYNDGRFIVFRLY